MIERFFSKKQSISQVFYIGMQNNNYYFIVKNNVNIKICFPHC